MVAQGGHLRAAHRTVVAGEGPVGGLVEPGDDAAVRTEAARGEAQVEQGGPLWLEAVLRLLQLLFLVVLAPPFRQLYGRMRI